MKIKIEDIEIELSNKITVFTGDNGVGKTRILQRFKSILENKSIFFKELSENTNTCNLEHILYHNTELLTKINKYIQLFFPDIVNIEQLKNNETKNLLIFTRNNETSYLFSGLSSGEKRIINILADIIVYDPEYIIIDDIDLYIHPKNHRSLINNLLELFPDKQFIISTNSPLILGEIKPENIRRLIIDSETNKLKCYIPKQSFGLDVNQVLSELMGCSNTLRNSEVYNKLEELSAIIDNENFSEARLKIDELETILNGSIPEIVGAETLISMLEDDLK